MTSKQQLDILALNRALELVKLGGNLKIVLVEKAKSKPKRKKRTSTHLSK